jgi:hypothetical protein
MDASSRHSLWDALRSAREGCVVVVSTHSMEEADAIADRYECVCMYVCVCVFVYVLWSLVHIVWRRLMRLLIGMILRMSMYVYLSVCVCVCVWVCLGVCLYICLSVEGCVVVVSTHSMEEADAIADRYECVCVYVCVCVCVCVPICV